MSQLQLSHKNLISFYLQVSHSSIDWSQKYGRRSRGLSPAKVARYGRHVLEVCYQHAVITLLYVYTALIHTLSCPLSHVHPGSHTLSFQAMMFLYSKNFPTLGHIQSGNIFVVDDVCRLGGYENTLLGYKTRLFRISKDHLEHLDTILFGELAGTKFKDISVGPFPWQALFRQGFQCCIQC